MPLRGQTTTANSKGRLQPHQQGRVSNLKLAKPISNASAAVATRGHGGARRFGRELKARRAMSGAAGPERSRNNIHFKKTKIAPTGVLMI